MLSHEATTQGDPLAIPWYSLSTVNIISFLQEVLPSVKQVWLADDVASAGKINKLHEWYQKLECEGKQIGYIVNGSKSWLRVKSQEIADKAKE